LTPGIALRPRIVLRSSIRRDREVTSMSRDLTWDAGDMGCGELIIKLKLTLRDEVGEDGVLTLIATDPGAREDIPAWCRMTGNILVQADHPRYVIQPKKKKEIST